MVPLKPLPDLETHGHFHIPPEFYHYALLGLQKQASVIDELILGIAAPQGSYKAAKAAEDYRLEELKKKYEQPRKDLADTNKIADSEKAIEKSNFTKQYKILEAPLSSRYCPELVSMFGNVNLIKKHMILIMDLY